MKPDIKKAAAAIDSFLAALDLPASSLAETRETGTRVAEAFCKDLLSGYRIDPARVLQHATQSQAKGLVVLCDVTVVTVCPHHLMPAMGVGHVGYVPDPVAPHVVGLGALGELLDCYSRRLALQEDVAHQVCEALVQWAHARAAACALRLSHACVTCRDQRRSTASVFTVAYGGEHASDASFRRDFADAIRTGSQTTHSP